MSLSLVWSNFVAYSLQIGLLIGVAALAPAILRLRSPRAKLAYWHILLLACLLLPLIRPWRQQFISDTVTVTSRVISVAPADPPATRSYSRAEIALAIVALGAAGRLLWLAAGFWKLGRYRRRSTPYRAPLPWPSIAELRLAPDIGGPVTFGARNPVILLPPQFPTLAPRARHAILCHELLHVDRHDWLFTIAEEVIRALFWFHPAIWWLLGEIQLAREQAVDRAVIELTDAKDEYVDALLAVAGAKQQFDLAPAPLFLRKRHLKHRVVSILKESRMSKTRLFSALAGSLGVLVAGCWLVTTTFPLAAAPQVVSDSAGVTVDVAGASLLHRAPVQYPESARAKGIQGTVSVELAFDSAGNVSDARVVSGPEELRKAALQSVLQWHFSRESAGSRRVVTMAFQLTVASETPALVRGGSTTLSVTAPDAGQQGTIRSALEADARLNQTAARITELQQIARDDRERTKRSVRAVNVLGLSDAARNEVLALLNVNVGDMLTASEAQARLQKVREYDEHLSSNVTYSGADQLTLTVVAPAPNATPREVSAPGNAIRVGGNAQAAKLIRQPRPAYPPDAKAARIQGVVKLMAVIATDGTVRQLDVISGHPLLVTAALEAVKQWVYSPTLLNDNPVEVQTQIDVNFTLAP